MSLRTFTFTFPHASAPIVASAGDLITLTGAGAGKVQYTYDSAAAISSQTAVWTDWPRGAVSNGTASDAVDQTCKIRAVVTALPMTLTIGDGPDGYWLPLTAWKSQRTPGDSAFIGGGSGSSLNPITATYTAAGAIAPTDTLSIINSASPVVMTLAAAADTHEHAINNQGVSGTTVALTLDGSAQIITMAKGDVLNVCYQSSLSSYIRRN